MFRALRTFTLQGRRIARGEILETVPAHLEGTFLRARFIEPHTVETPNLENLPKARLLELADELGVDVPSGLRVAEIRELLKAEVS